MENYKNDGFDSQFSDRRDYGSERHSEKNYTSGYSQAGRKLRHRKNYTGGSDEERSGRTFQDRRSSGYGERRSYGSGRYSMTLQSVYLVFHQSQQGRYYYCASFH